VAGQLLRIAAILACIALAFIGILNLLAHILLYHPHPYRANYQQLLAMRVTELPFKTNAGHQTAFYIPPHVGSGVPDRIWATFCGNGSLALDWLPLTAKNQIPGDAFLLVDYPGYGKSEGWPNAANTRLAADGALVALAARLGIDPTKLESRLGTMGHSLGAAAALDFANHHPQVHQIILLAPFTSLREEAAHFLPSLFTRALVEKYDNRAVLRRLAQLRPPPRVVIFHGLQDGLIPPAMGRELAAEFPGFVTFRGFPEADHNTIAGAAQDEILQFMANEAKDRIAR
jgi:pimeloyl-ACP methyl ester carboxylesterase